MGTSYVIEKWTNAGAVVREVERAAKWWAQPLGDSPATQRPGGWDIYVESLREDADGTLWVFLRLPQTYWESRSRAEKGQERTRAEMQALPRVPAFYRLLDVLDPGTGRVVYTDSLASFISVVTPDVVFCGSKEDENGFSIWSLCRLTLVNNDRASTRVT